MHLQKNHSFSTLSLFVFLYHEHEHGLLCYIWFTVQHPLDNNMTFYYMEFSIDRHFYIFHNKCKINVRKDVKLSLHRKIHYWQCHFNTKSPLLFSPSMIIDNNIEQLFSSCFTDQIPPPSPRPTAPIPTMVRGGDKTKNRQDRWNFYFNQNNSAFYLSYILVTQAFISKNVPVLTSL